MLEVYSSLTLESQWQPQESKLARDSCVHHIWLLAIYEEL